ncbi:replication protein C [Methanofollis aquaemaris]|uniref:Replication factor C small subunit n=1 Tax=Methanofollis aquaemaris TaxID=126734 RepID=A0A8A3S3R9_9EURY|nr:replication protein C [Methanofollis aquaemaris]QSZ66712.1 replication protein C [Methanofollis aquaemaris]
MLWSEKYRPTDFSAILGQDEVVRVLSSFAESKNVPHLLVVGAPGTGKSVAVEALARGLYGAHWQENTTVLPTADLFEGGKKYFEAEERFAHIYRKDESLISNFKNVVRWYASIRPLDAEFRLLIFEGASALTREAQQALRRTMERYSRTCRFVFLTSNQSAVIPAVASRCLPLTFVPLPDGVVRRRLEEVMAAEGVGDDQVAPADLDLIVPSAGGDLRRAIILLQLFAGSEGEVDLAATATSETESLAASIFEALAKSDLQGARQWAEALLIDYGLTGHEVIRELARAADRVYADPRIAVALADAELSILRGGNEYVQINALLARISREVFF